MGFFGTDIDIEYHEAEKHYTILSKTKTSVKVICNHCEGSGQYEAMKLTNYGYTTNCNFCYGKGFLTIKLRGIK